MVIALEGIPGAGKTTTASLLANRLGIDVIRETTHDHPFLETVYDDANRFDLQVELGFLLLHNAAYRTLDRDATVVADFAPGKDLLFAEAMLEGRDLPLFEALYHHLYDGHALPEFVIYLDVEPELCLQRIQRRLVADPQRSFEAGMTIERLGLMHDIYEARLAELGQAFVRFAVNGRMSEAQVVDGLVELLRVSDLPAEIPVLEAQ